jgi:hypothetical protein
MLLFLYISGKLRLVIYIYQYSGVIGARSHCGVVQHQQAAAIVHLKLNDHVL